jgi:type 1 glutamine amidotransferase
MDKKLKAAIITEFHPIDMIEFHKLFWGFEEFDCYIQSFDMFVTDEKNRETYDVVVYYNMSRPMLAEDHKIRKYLEEKLGSTRQGILLLHHGILCYPGWNIWTELTGIDERKFKYHWDQTVRYDIVNQEHPITKGLRPFAMIDETYVMDDPDESLICPLIQADHPLSMKNIAWTRQYKNSRVFSYVSGHDDTVYNDVHFKEILRRGMLWCSNQI